MLQFYTVVILGLLVYCITFISTHHMKYNIMQIEIFNRKPFSCWLCSNFWLSIFIWINLSYIFTPLFMLWGTIITLMTTYIIYKEPF